ncbi:hypothetical protein [Streptomyces sp. CB03911]|uniref:hypothetical protein n=1 Tax=Streptomyces sp. CB03911 TaxID=1804758 RepID=UPI00093D6B78|nr:hypothetical protein [Streptomyces sp. CB03911]OKI16576.1 hypothetical protein A6A07_11245 [Streptomyces sp. CB03911]
MTVTDAEALAAAIRELGERPTSLPASLNPLIADMLTAWHQMTGWDPDHLHRVAGPETVTLARAIIGRPADACPTCGGDQDCHQLGCQPTT